MIMNVFVLAALFCAVSAVPLLDEGIDDPEDCSNCKNEMGGVGYLPDDFYCVMFYPCVPDDSAPDGFRKGEPLCCRPGMCWDQERLTCVSRGSFGFKMPLGMTGARPEPPCPPLTPLVIDNSPFVCPYLENHPRDRRYYPKDNTALTLWCDVDEVFSDYPECACVAPYYDPGCQDDIIHFHFSGNYDSYSCGNFVKGTPHNYPVLTADFALCVDESYVEFNYLNNFFIDNPKAYTFSVTMFAKANSNIGFGGLLCNGDCHQNWSFCTGMDNALFDGGMYTGAFPKEVASYTFPGGFNSEDWHHYAMTYDGATVRIYVDGAEVDSYLNSDPLDNVQAATSIGVACLDDVTPNAPDYLFFKGCIDDVRIYTRTLGLAEVHNLYTIGRSNFFIPIPN